ncbi:discoidin domain-containing protein [Novosphingobium sp.]|uniref:discoidin domain-containing protein n=1 Tax=Novosphingobium sp. TaxID=1874826 RepID=UPI00286E5DEA|nr:discoidin domain-containing protein [Novosphingobium sp.]
MAITKPFAVIPHPLGTVASGNELASRPALHLGEFKDPGMVWQSSGASSLWVRGDFGSNKIVNFCSVLSANALPGTQIRLRLGDTQAEADGSGGGSPISVNGNGVANAATYTASSDHASYTGALALASNGAGMIDYTTTGSPTTAHMTSISAGQWIKCDLGSSANIDTVELIDNPTWAGSALNGAVVAGSNDNSSWTTIHTVTTITTGVAYIVTVGAAWRYIRVSGPSGGTGLSEFRVKPTIPATPNYDSGNVTFINPAITREDGKYGSHLELPSEITARWWRIDITGHTGDFQAMALVLGKKASFGTFYNDKGFEFGQEDMGAIGVGRFGVVEEETGIKLRTLAMDFGWLSDSDRHDIFQPLRDKLGVTGMALWCFDPDATVQRQDKTYFGWLRKPAMFRAASFRHDRWQSQFDIRSII